MEHPNYEQARAVMTFAANNGKAWKRALREHWINDCSAHRMTIEQCALLRQVRNQFGPSWLNEISTTRLAELCKGPE